LTFSASENFNQLSKSVGILSNNTGKVAEDFPYFYFQLPFNLTESFFQFNTNCFPFCYFKKLNPIVSTFRQWHTYRLRDFRLRCAVTRDDLVTKETKNERKKFQNINQ